MALQSSGQISFTNIKDEFGLPSGGKFGDYRISKDIGELSNMPLDDGIPQSGQIKFSDFYGKKLNIVIDCHSGGAQTRKNAKTDKWDGNKYDMVTNWNVPKPNSTNGKKVIIHVDKTFKSSAGNSLTDCALRTGTWDSGTTLQVDIGAEGQCYGAGGNGGDGADGQTDYGPTSGGGNGSDGSSALGIEHNPTTVNVLSGGQLRCGYGGGAGGRGARDVDPGRDRTACGGGGGGGAGTPAGAGGEGGETLSGGQDEVTHGYDGGAGSAHGATGGGGGNGGNGGNNYNEAIGQTGGVGGDEEQAPGTATGGKKVGSSSPGDPGVNASAGGNGAAIRRTNANYVVTVTNFGTIKGSTTETGVT